MRWIKLGTTGLDVSPICLGCMSYGVPRGVLSWALEEEASRPLLQHALDVGINFFDTANVYSAGESERILGRVIKESGRRDEVVIATKVFGRVKRGPNQAGLSRKAIMTEINASLDRLQTDYVDLYQIHRHDPLTPIEETMEALHDVVKAGKARYIGASSMPAWLFAKAQHTAQIHGWTRFVSMQSHYNLLYREEEREMIPLCEDQGVATIPWSPLARGWLAREWNSATTTRSSEDDRVSTLYDGAANDAAHEIVDRVTLAAHEHGVPRAQVALAWLRSQPTVTAPIIGATKASHIDEAVGSVDLELTEHDLRALGEPYQPRAVAY